MEEYTDDELEALLNRNSNEQTSVSGTFPASLNKKMYSQTYCIYLPNRSFELVKACERLDFQQYK